MRREKKTTACSELGASQEAIFKRLARRKAQVEKFAYEFAYYANLSIFSVVPFHYPSLFYRPISEGAGGRQILDRGGRQDGARREARGRGGVA
jgi:hypothetical protein